MGVARQIGEDLLRSCEGTLGVDDPLALAERCEPVGKCIGVGQIDMLAEELQLNCPRWSTPELILFVPWLVPSICSTL